MRISDWSSDVCSSDLDLGKAYVGSLTMGAGQFCTNPGIVVALDSPDLDRFVDAAAEALGGAAPQVMLTGGIHANYDKGVTLLGGHSGVETIARGTEDSGAKRGRAALFGTTGAAFVANPALADEVFGAASIVIRCADKAEVARVLEGLEGQLTATLQLDDEDVEDARALLPILERKADRKSTRLNSSH